MRNFLFALCLVLVPASGPTAAPDLVGAVRGHVVVVKGSQNLSAENVWVYLKPKKRGMKFTKVMQSINQQYKRFTPSVRVIPVGSSVKFPNLDKDDHNVFSPTEPNFDLGRSKNGSPTREFLDAGEYDIFCDLHVEMAATVKVVESDWIAEVKVKDGAFTLDRVPPGEYKLIAWMPGSDETIESVTVTADATTTPPPIKLQAPKLVGPKPHKRVDGRSYPVKGYPGKP